MYLFMYRHNDADRHRHYHQLRVGSQLLVHWGLPMGQQPLRSVLYQEEEEEEEEIV
jgi:hypothetical protein